MNESTQYKLAEVQFNGMTFTAHADIYPDGAVVNRWTRCTERSSDPSDLYVSDYQDDARWSVVENHLASYEPQAEILCQLIKAADEQLKHFINELTK